MVHKTYVINKIKINTQFLKRLNLLKCFNPAKYFLHNK